MSRISLPAAARAGALALCLFLSNLSGAHGPDHALEAAARAPAPGAAVETLAGSVHRLTIDDRVAGISLDIVSVTSDDGRSVVLRGDTALSDLRTGDRARVTGRRNGNALFVESARVTSRATGNQSKAAPAAYEGTLKLLHVDYADERSSEYLFELHQDDGQVRVLQLPIAPEALQGGMKVRVSGRMGAGARTIVPDAVTVTALSPTDGKDAVVAKATRTNAALVILMTFSDSGAAPFSQAQVQSVFAGGAGSGSVTEFFKEASYGQQLLSATVTNWLPTNAATPAGCDWQTMGTLGRNAATAAGYNVNAYQNVVYVFPSVAACGWVGLGYIGGNGVWINGRNVTSAYAHELGHNFGLLHAGSVRCSAGAIGGTCTVAEYGDPFDTMGNQSAMHYNAPQKLSLGWIPGASVVTHQAGSNTYALTPLELAGGTTYAVKVPVATNRTYWLEYRQPIGFDAGLSAYPNNGVQVRVSSPFETMCSGCNAYSNDTELLDMTPGTASFTDATLLAGNSFTDPTYGVTFNVLSANSTGVTVQVSMGGSAPPPTTVTSIANGGFESPSLAGGYQYNPGGATWTFAGAAGVTGNGNAFTSGNPAAPEGVQTGFLQGAGSSASESVSLSAGQYTVSFKAAQRGNYQVGAQVIQVLVDGLAVGQFQPSGTAYATYQTSAFAIAAAGSHTIMLKGIGTGSDFTAFVDDVRVTASSAAPALANAGFEAPAVGTYQYVPAGGSWAFGGGAGISANGSGFTSGNPAAPQGTQVAFLQGASSISQTVSLAAGQYVLSFSAAQRGNYQSGTQVIQIEVDGVAVARFQPPAISYTAYQTAAFAISATGNHSITLRGVGTGADFTAFVDAVAIAATSAASGAAKVMERSMRGTTPTPMAKLRRW